MKKIGICLIIVSLFQASLYAQTVGLLKSDPGAFDGYTMIGKSGVTYLLDEGGQIVHTWDTGNLRSHPGYLMDNGDLIAVFQGIKRMTWDGTLVWEYSNVSAHHDVAVMPNGNVLLLIRGAKTNAESITAGRNPALLDDDLEPMIIYEVNPLGAIIWEWHVWDHLIQDFNISMDNYGVVSEHPELVDINYTRDTTSDWLHGNAIDYHPELDQIMVSPRYNNEIWIIDHSTTTEEAASHAGGQANKGGDLLYRWGNPEAYGRGDISDRQTFGSHDANWITSGLQGEGNILLFNNGGIDYGSDGDYSTIDELIPPLNGFNYDLVSDSAYMPSMPDWMFIGSPRESFYSSYISSAQRLPNGNTFIDEGAYGFLFEVTNAGEIVWQYQSPIDRAEILFQGDPPPLKSRASLFRAYKYAKNHPGLVGRNLVAQGSVEQYIETFDLTVTSSLNESVSYPGIGTFNIGENQLVPLIATELPGFTFVNWSVISGGVVIDDTNAKHTTVQMGNNNVEIHANYIAKDLIYFNGFE